MLHFQHFLLESAPQYRVYSVLSLCINVSHTVLSNVLYLFYVLVFWVLNWRVRCSSKLPYAKNRCMCRCRSRDEGRCLTRSNAKLCTIFPWSSEPERMRAQNVQTKCLTCFKYMLARSRPFAQSPRSPMPAEHTGKYLNWRTVQCFSP